MKNIFLFTLTIAFLNSCVKEDYFGLSDSADILNIQVSNQADQAQINSETHIIILNMTPGVDISKSVIQELELSSFATTSKQVGDTLNLTHDNVLEIIAENGNIVSWKLEAQYASAEPQLSNTDFNMWYQTAKGYYEPGAAADNTVWCTGNAGTSLLGLYATTPYDKDNDDYAVKMETLDNGRLSAAFGAPISAGSIMTGVFNADNIDPANPRAAIDFGTLFTGRPSALRISYSYTPGKVNKDKDGNKLDYGDMCDIYAILEVRQDDEARRLATAWFRSGDEQQDSKDLELVFSYGKLDDSFPDYMKPTNGLYVNSDIIDYVLPTHIIFVASSSYNGDHFAGAVGSTLYIDNLWLEY